MDAKEEVFIFLKNKRNIPDSVINKLKDDKIDINVINVMTDDELKQYIERYGDRLALRAFCRQGTVTSESGVKPSLMQRVRDRLREREQLKTSADNGTAAGPSRRVGNSYATKDNRRIEMGWLHYDKVDFHQVRTRHGGGTRHLTVQKTVTMEELLEIGKGLFFPNGQSSKGLVEDHQFDIWDFSHNPVPLENTVSQLYDQTKLRNATHLYLLPGKG
ncbi:uncharacterized protein LOC134020504 [Osmerus eperlanus]|uniref:uncharacterized protein LOC134020504 n=1 Tax=Osmerus eperlanus TaxID=29151 RepID=UPI002E11FA7D